jgi:hypothetical protein
MAENNKKLDGPCKLRIFPNYSKKGAQPDYKGVLTDEMGDEFIISCWKTKMAGDNFYLAGRIIRKTDLEKIMNKNKTEEPKKDEDSDFNLFD